MPRIEVLVGMIASGKSTYARRRADEGAMVVCHDDLTEMLHGRYRYEQGLKALYRRAEEAIALEALLCGKDVVIDRTHLTRESRDRWAKFVRLNNTMVLFGLGERPATMVAVEFPRQIAYVHARRRYESDSRGRPFHEWLKVALHHQEQADREPLTDHEGFDEIVRIDRGAA